MPSANENNLRRRLLQLAGSVLAPRHTPPATQPGPPSNVLLLRPDHIGDVLLTAPAVALLRASLPQATLTYVVGPWSLDAARYGPTVDHLRTLHFPAFTRQPAANPVAPYLLLLSTAFKLRRERYDLAIVFRPDHWWGALLTLVGGVPLRVGGATPETTPLLTHTLAPSSDRHAADRALDFARLALQVIGLPATGATITTEPPFRIPPKAAAEATALWHSLNLTDRPVIAIQPNAGVPLKSWPIDRWAALADALLQRGLQVILVGAPDDSAVLGAIQSRLGSTAEQSPVRIACGQPLAVSAALYARSAVLVGPDSGAAHLAAAVGTPTVRLYGPAQPNVFGPWPPGPQHRVLLTGHLACVPCGDLVRPPCGAERLPACMLALDVADVLEQVQTVLPGDFF